VPVGEAAWPAPAHRRSRRRWLAAAVATCLTAGAASAAAAGGFWQAQRRAGQLPAAITLAGMNPALHVRATALLTATSWGTSIQLRLRGLPLNVQCRLIVRSRGGTAEVAGIWDAWHGGPITIPASAAWRPSDIASLQIVTAGRDLVTLQANPRQIPAGAASDHGQPQ
jgi:hypothetical protein